MILKVQFAQRMVSELAALQISPSQSGGRVRFQSDIVLFPGMPYTPSCSLLTLECGKLQWNLPQQILAYHLPINQLCKGLYRDLFWIFPQSNEDALESQGLMQAWCCHMATHLVCQVLSCGCELCLPRVTRGHYIRSQKRDFIAVLSMWS